MTRVSVRLAPAGRQDFVPLSSARVRRPCHRRRAVHITHHALIQSGALCYMALCVAWRFVLHGALCYVALCATWRFPVALSGPPYVALSNQKAPNRAGVKQ